MGGGGIKPPSLLDLPLIWIYNNCMMNERIREERELQIRIESISLGIVVGCVVTVLIFCIGA